MTNEILSPLPGILAEVKVKAGDQVKAGDILFVIEAMKTLYEVASTQDGIVAAIKVDIGDEIMPGMVLGVVE